MPSPTRPLVLSLAVAAVALATPSASIANDPGEPRVVFSRMLTERIELETSALLARRIEQELSASPLFVDPPAAPAARIEKARSFSPPTEPSGAPGS